MNKARSSQARSNQIREFILDHAQEHPRDVARMAGQTFGITRQSVAKHLGVLVGQGLLRAQGHTKGREYHLQPICNQSFEIEVTQSLQENQVWRHKMAPFLVGVTDTVQEICQYGFTEMLNNVVSHSQSPVALVSVQVNAANVRMMVADTGIGIFKKIQNEFGMDDAQHALLELSKGKLTSRPESLTGEGVFFTSWMFDRFSILSDQLFYRRTSHQDQRVPGDRAGVWAGDWRIEIDDIDPVTGTVVFMDINPASKRTVQKVMDRYSGDGGSPGFNATRVPAMLARYDGEQLVSRSQAKRLLVRMDRFSDVCLDFQDVGSIGHSFADEIFRVFAAQHPEIRMHWVNTEPAVTQMIQRVRSNAGAGV